MAHIVVAASVAKAGELAVEPRQDKTASARQPASPMRFDYRLVALGAWLPDMIDKPMAWFSIPHAWPDDHLFAHTLLFVLLVCLPGIFLGVRGDFRLLSVGVGVLAHRVCDPIYMETETLFWPAAGFEFHEHTTGIGLANNLQLDVIAGVAAGLFGLALWRGGRLPALIHEGRI